MYEYIFIKFMVLTGTSLQQCKQYLISCYEHREMEPTRWSKFGGLSVYLDVAIMRSPRLEDKFREEHAMGLVDKMNYISIDKILTDGYQKISLIEGDPGAGKTTLTSKICKEWAGGIIRVLSNDLLFWIPLRDSYYHKINRLNELFDKLNCPKMLEYAQQYNGKGLVFVLDGWDELPGHLQSQSFFHDIIFKKSTLTCSTIILTSRPSCSDSISEAVGNRYYQILGLTANTVVIYIKEYFKSNPQFAASLLDVLRSHENLRRHFYIPITVVIMCFVYRNSDYQMPASISKLYEKFVILCIRSNIPESQRKQFKSLQNVPSELRPVFKKLCALALTMLLDNKLVFDGEDLKDLPVTNTEQFDGFGLLHIEHVTDEFGEKAKCYSFIHRAVQELMAAISILESKTVEDAINKYFSKMSYLRNMFPFIFGLMPKEDLKPIVERLKQIFIESNGHIALQNNIFYCLFEAQDELLCIEFGKVFNITNRLILMPYTLLDYHYAFYFLSTCKLAQLNVDCSSVLADIHIEVMAKYFCKSFTQMVSFYSIVSLQKTGMASLCRILSCQHNLLSLEFTSKSTIVHAPGCIKVLCDSICKHHLQITTLKLPPAKLCEQDLDSLGHVITTLQSLQSLDMRRCDGTSLKSSRTFCDALRNAKHLKTYTIGICLFSVDDIDLFRDIANQNSSIKRLNACDVYDANVITSIVQGLSSNQTMTTFIAWPGPLDTSHNIGQSLGKCLASNQTLTDLDFTSFGFYEPMENLQWSSEHVCCICTGLQSNNSLATLDISGCYVEKAASDAVCVMLSINTSLKHLFLNPVHLEKAEAIAIFNSCINNTTLELLTLVWLPGGELAHVPWSSSHPSELKLKSHNEVPMWSTESIFPFAEDSEIITILDQVQMCRQDKKKPSLTVLW